MFRSVRFGQVSLLPVKRKGGWFMRRRPRWRQVVSNGYEIGIKVAWIWLIIMIEPGIDAATFRWREFDSDSRFPSLSICGGTGSTRCLSVQRDRGWNRALKQDLGHLDVARKRPLANVKPPGSR